jgi:hypothetical protein
MKPTEEPEIPSRGFAKLDSGIIYSTLWMQSHDVVRVWIALLAMADANGRIRSSVPAFAHLCFVSPDRMREILEIFKAPDPDSRITQHEGRKIRDVDGGWLVLNYTKYRNLMQRKPGTHGERQARWRQRHRKNPRSASPSVTRDTEAEAEAEADSRGKAPRTGNANTVNTRTTRRDEYRRSSNSE